MTIEDDNVMCETLLLGEYAQQLELEERAHPTPQRLRSTSHLVDFA